MLSIEKKSDNLFKFFFDNSIDLLCIANTSGVFEKLNPEWEKVLGYKLEELEGKAYIDFVHPDDIEETIKATSQLSNDKEIHNLRNRYRHKNGAYLWLEWRSYPKDNKIFATARNITKNLIQEEALKQKEETNRLITSITTDYVFKLELNKKKKADFVYVAGNIEEVTGLRLTSKSQTHSPKEFIFPADYPVWENFLEKTINSCKSGEIECRVISDEPQRWIQIIAKPIQDKISGKVISIYVAIKDITKRKRAEQKLLLSEEKFLKSFMSAPEVVVIANYESKKYIEVNDVFVKITGYSREEVIGKSPKEINIWVEEDKRNSFLQSFEKNHRVSNFETKFRIKSGEKRDCLINGEIIIINGERCFLLFIKDITEQKKAEFELADTKALLSSSVMQTPIGMLIVTARDFAVRWLNHSCMHLLGISNKDKYINQPLTEKNFTWKLYDTMGQKVSFESRPIVQALQGNFINNSEYIVVRQDGTKKWISANASPIENENKEIIAALFSLTDITEQKNTKEKFRQLANLHQNILDTVSVGILHLKNGKIQWVNHAFEKMYGYSSNEIIGKETSILYTNPEEALTIRNDAIKVLEEKKIYTNDISGIKKNGKSFWVRISGSAINKDNIYEGSNWIIQDITEKKESELALRKNETIIKATMESINDGMLIVAENNLISNHNSRIREIFCLSTVIIDSKDSYFVFNEIKKQLIQPDNYINRITEIYNSGEPSSDLLKLKNRHFIEQHSYLLKGESPVKGRVWLFRDVTLQKTAEEALRESENKFRNLAESALVGIYLVQDNKFKYVNPCFADIHGYEVEELINTINPRDLIIPEDIEQSNQEKQDHKKGSSYQQIRIVTKFGEVRYAESLGTLTKFNGKPAIIGTLTDVTEKKKAEEALLKSQSMLLNSQRIAQLGSWKLDIINNSFFIDELSFQILGITNLNKKLYFEDFLEEVHPDDIELVKQHLKESIHLKKLKDFECRIILPSKEIRFVRIGGEVLTDNSNNPIQMTGIIQDITESKLAETTKLQDLKFLEDLDKINMAIQGTDDYLEMIKNIAKTVLKIFACDRVILLSPNDQNLKHWGIPVEYTHPNYPGIHKISSSVNTRAKMENLFKRLLVGDEILELYHGENMNIEPDEELWEQFEIKSLLATSIRVKIGNSWFLGIQQCSHIRRWTSFDKKLFKEISRRLSDGLSNLLIKKNLQDNEIFLNKIFENIPNMIIVKDVKSSNYLRINKTGEDILEYSQEEIIGKNEYDIFQKQKANFYKKRDEEILQQKKLIEFQDKIVSKRTKKTKILHTKMIPILDEHGKPKFIVNISEDISKQKQIETERLHNLMFFESLDRINRVIQRAVDLEYLFTYVLDEIINIFNCDRSFLLYPLDEKADYWEIPMERTNGDYPSAFKTGEKMPMTPKLKRLQKALINSSQPIELRYKKEINPDEEPWKQFQIKSAIMYALFPKIGKPWVIGLHHCVAPRNWLPHEIKLFKEISNRIADGLTSLLIFRKQKSNEEFLDKVFEIIPNIISVKDAKTLEYIKVNKAAEKVFKYSPQELSTEQANKIMQEKQVYKLSAIDKKVIESKKLVEIKEEKIKNKDNQEIILHTKKIPILDESGETKYIVGVSEDITERKQIEAEKTFNLTLLKNLDRVNRAMQSTNNIELMMKNVLYEVLSIFNCDRAFLLYPCDPKAPKLEQVIESTSEQYPGTNEQCIPIEKSKTFNKLYKTLLDKEEPVELINNQDLNLNEEPWKTYEVKSMLSIAIYPKIGKPWHFGIHQCSHIKSWEKHEKILFQEISRRIADGLSTLLINRDKLDNEEFLNIIFENIPNMIFVKDAKTLNYVRLNKAGEKLLGYSEKELTGKNDYDFFPQDEADFFISKDKEVFKSKKLLEIKEETLLNKNKEIRILHTKKLPILDDKKRPKYLLGISEDITEKKKAEESIRETKERLEIFIDSITDSITIFNSELKLVEINKIGLLYFPKGTKKTDLLGKKLQDITHNFKGSILIIENLKEVMATGKPLFFDDKVTIDNKVYYVNVKVFRVGKGVGFIVTDVTEQKSIETTLRETKELLQSFMDSATDSMAIYDKNLRLIKYNETTLSFLPKPLNDKELIGYHLHDFMPHLKSTKIFDEATKVLETGNSYQSEDLLIVNAEKKIWFDTKIFKVGEGIGILSSDITPIKMAEEKVKILNTELEIRVKERTTELEQANKELEAFAYSVSHDLRAPLRHIDGFVQLMHSNIESHNEKINQYYERINSSTKRMSNMIDELLNFSRLGRKTLNIVPIQLGQLLKEILEQLKPDYTDRSIQWKINELPEINGDASLIKVAFENILSNAIKYTLNKTDARIEIGAKFIKKDYITIYVKDNGAGFDMKYIDKLFGVFQRLHSKEEFEGIGIGLANTKQIISKHKGFITAESKLNEGATFYISLPINISYE